MTCLLLAACSSQQGPSGPNFTMRPDGAAAIVVAGKAPDTTVLIFPLGRNGTPALTLKSFALDYFDASGARRLDLAVAETLLAKTLHVPTTSSTNPPPTPIPLPIVSAAVLAYGKSLTCLVTLKGATDQDYEVNLTTEFPIVFK
ncbi:MAG: hypothetical protein JWM80_388 [Cyanobacteria bacterium RYN_339]|nr:hypothetical protein [Cyanobacteria bacterium RYN_339]